MAAPGESDSVDWFDESWRPRSLRPPRPSAFPRKGRVLLLAAVVAAHLFGALFLLARRDEPGFSGERALQVEFVFEWPELPPEPVVEPEAPEQAASGPAAAPRPDAPRRVPPPPRAPGAPASAPALADATLAQRLYDADGRVRLSKEVMAELDKTYGDARRFSYEIPRMGDAEKLFYRKPVVTYEATRFDAYWTPDADLLTSLLTQLAEKTTKEIRVPVPGRPDSKMVCKISLLALGGGCGILTNGWDYAGPVDDPATLSEEEDRQCQAWWDQIVGATTQDAWRSTRKLYDQECRKPRERKPAG
jgi:hypothetical protein